MVHTSNIVADEQELCSVLFEREMSKTDLAEKICNYLAELTKQVFARKEAVLISIGGETSYKCCKAIETNSLQVIDSVQPAIPLCLDTKAQWIVTKSGNLGSVNVLIDILKYFEQHEQE